jgi:exonuclease VII small subunit
MPVLARLVSPSSNQVPLPDLAQLAKVQHWRAGPLFRFLREPMASLPAARLHLAPLVLLAVAGLAHGCASSGYEQASDTADETAAYRDRLVRLRAQVGLAADALRGLSENPGDSPHSNQETFETFALELENLGRAATRAREAYQDMNGRAGEFFGGWTTDTAAITNAELKQSSETRRTALEANYRKLEQGQKGVEEATARYERALGDLRLYLEHDLTAAGIASAEKSIHAAFVSGALLQEEIDTQAQTALAARDSLAPLRDLAASQQRSARDGRVH